MYFCTKWTNLIEKSVALLRTEILWLLLILLLWFSDPKVKVYSRRMLQHVVMCSYYNLLIPTRLIEWVGVVVGVCWSMLELATRTNLRRFFSRGTLQHAQNASIWSPEPIWRLDVCIVLEQDKICTSRPNFERFRLPLLFSPLSRPNAARRLRAASNVQRHEVHGALALSSKLFFEVSHCKLHSIFFSLIM